MIQLFSSDKKTVPLLIYTIDYIKMYSCQITEHTFLFLFKKETMWKPLIRSSLFASPPFSPLSHSFTSQNLQNKDPLKFYNSELSNYVKNGKYYMAQQLWKQIKDKGINPDGNSYGWIIFALEKQQKLIEAEKVRNEAMENSIIIKEVTQPFVNNLVAKRNFKRNKKVCSLILLGMECEDYNYHRLNLCWNYFTK